MKEISLKEDKLVEQLARSISHRETLPEFPPGLSLGDGYRIQAAVCKSLCPDGVRGLKAGVTSSAMQKHFGLSHALMGQLYNDGQPAEGARLPYLKGRSFECEIGVIVDAEGNPKLAGPAIEVVNLQFARREDATAANLIACNLAADTLLRAEFTAWRDSYADIRVTLYRNDEVVNEASMMESLGGPHEAIRWMCDEAQARECVINGDTLFMTGTCGGVVPAEPGLYRADYGVLGSFSFEVLPE